jgi:hypothetical protein
MCPRGPRAPSHRDAVSEPTRRTDALALAVLAAIITLLFLDVLLGINALYIRDVAHYYYPAKHVLREIVLGGDFPSWNPYFGAGQPLAANPEHEVFYPLTWLILLPSYRVAFHLLVLLHLYIAGFTMYALLRSMRLQPPGAFFGALSFAIGGIALSYLNLLPYLFNVAWLPLTCLYTRRFLLRRGRRDFAAAAFFFGLQLLTGEPSTILQGGLLLGFYALHRCARERTLRPVLSVALISAAAFAVGAVQMIPALDHASGSVRAHGLSFATAADWSMPALRLGQFFDPNFLGHVDLEGRTLYWGGKLYPGRSLPFLYSIYPGLLVSVLALAGLFARLRGWVVTAAIGALSIVLALGGNTPAWGLLYDLGAVRWLRYPEKFMLMAVFAAIVFGARALDEMLGGNERVHRAARLTALAVFVLAALGAVVARTPFYVPLFARLWHPNADRAAAMLAASATNWLVVAGRAAIVFLLVRNAARQRVWLVLAAAFVVLDLGIVVFEAVPRMPVRFYDEVPAVARQLPADRSAWRLFHHAEWHRKRPAVKAYFERDPDLYWVNRNAMLPMIPAQYGIRMALDSDYDLTALTPTADFVQSVADLSDLRPDWVDVAASMSNVWYRAVFRAPAEAFAEAHGDRRVLQPVGILAMEHYPRYYFADRVVPIADRADFVRKVARTLNVKRTAFVRGAGFVPAAGKVTGVRESANTARIDVDTAGRAFLVMSVTPHQYWRVTIDGAEATAIVTNIGYQGVVVPARGRHVVEMRYRNPLIAIGAAVSLVSLLALAFITMRRL